MNRRLLVLLLAGGALVATACGADPAQTTAPTSTSAPSSGGAGGAGTADAGSDPGDDLGSLQDEADQVLEQLFEADRDLDYRTIESLTSRAVAARYRSQELLGSIEGLDERFKIPPSKSVTVTSDLEVEEPDGDAVGTTGSVTVTYEDDAGEETTQTYEDIVFERDGDELLVADWRSDYQGMLASAAFLNTADAEPVTVDDVTVTLESGYREPNGDPAFVEYVFTVENGTDLDVDVQDVELTTPDGETYAIQFGVADTAEPGDTVAARVGFEGPTVPVWGGTMTVRLEDEDGGESWADLEVPPFVDEDGEPEAARTVELDDVPFSASGTAPSADTSEGTEVLQEITDAASFRDSLLAIAEQQHDPSRPADAWGIPDAWLEAVPGLELVGFQIEATPTKVSGFSITGDKAGTTEGLPFTVIDASGTCAGGVVMGRDGEPSEFRAVELSGATTCNAAAVIELVGLA